MMLCSKCNSLNVEAIDGKDLKIIKIIGEKISEKDV